MPEFQVHTIDLLVLMVYVMGTRVLFGWYFARKTRGGGSEDYFLAGRSLGWPIIGLSFYVSNMSGSTFVGLPGAGYADGIAVFHYEWLPALILIFFIWFMLPLFLQARVFTAPEFLEKRFDRSSRLAFSGFLLLANVFIDAAAALYAGAAVAQVLIPGFPLWGTVAITAAIATAYIFFGGLGAVVINDTVQAALIIMGGTLIAILTWRRIPSWEAVVESSPEGALHLFQPASDAVMPWPGVFTGVLIIGIYFWCTNQFVIQRALGARSLDHGRRGALFAGLLKLPNLFILILPGVMATALYTDLERPDFVFPALAFDVLPIGLRGLMLAALAAAILSSLEAILNSASTLFTVDFVKTLRPHTRDQSLVWIGRWATVGLMVLAVLWTPVILTFPTLWQYLQSILAYVTPPIVAVFLAGIFWPRTNARGAFVTIATGVPLGVLAWLGNEILHLTSIQFLYGCGIMFVVSAAILLVATATGPAPDARKVGRNTWTPRLWRRDTAELRGVAWYANHRVLAVLLGALSLALVAWWW